MRKRLFSATPARCHSRLMSWSEDRRLGLAQTRARLDGDLYLVGRTRKYVLLRLDEMLARGQGVTYDHPLITVEHVLPQNPRIDSRWAALFDEDERAEWTHGLGNLVLLNRSKNSAAQNYDFAVKKAKYCTGRGGVVPFALTSQVLQHAEWVPAVLSARQKQLVELLADEWDLWRSVRGSPTARRRGRRQRRECPGSSGPSASGLYRSLRAGRGPTPSVHGGCGRCPADRFAASISIARLLVGTAPGGRV
jgi:hypothetical protein